MLHLKKLREQKQLTQSELSKLLGISPSTIGMYEQGRREPDNETLKKIAVLFGVSTDYLLGNDHPTPGYYDDPEVAEMANRLKDDPDMKILFDASKKLSKDDLQFVIDMVHRMKKE